MNDRHTKVLADLRELVTEVRDNRFAYALASRYCPEPWSRPLAETGDSFMMVEMKLQGISSQVEAIFDELWPDQRRG